MFSSEPSDIYIRRSVYHIYVYVCAVIVRLCQYVLVRVSPFPKFTSTKRSTISIGIVSNTISLPLKLSYRHNAQSYIRKCPILPHSDLPPHIPSGFKLLTEVIEAQYLSDFFPLIFFFRHALHWLTANRTKTIIPNDDNQNHSSKDSSNFGIHGCRLWTRWYVLRPIELQRRSCPHNEHRLEQCHKGIHEVPEDESHIW